MPDWCWLLLGGSVGLAAAIVAGYYWAVFHYRRKFLEQIVRIFEEKPFFIIPRGTPNADAEDIRFRAPDGLTLRGCYLQGIGDRRGVILFGLEFGSDRWSSVQYCEKLRAAGYDVFAYEPRNQGESDRDPKYAPLQWVTALDLDDARAAVAYLKSRPDADSRGLGVFGISKGGCIAFLLAAEDPSIRCVVTDGAYDTYLTMVPYMRRWVSIYSPRKKLQKLCPDFFYGDIGMGGIREAAARREVEFLWVGTAARNIAVPVFMIHGEADTYIKPDMAMALFRRVWTPEKQLWVVPKAKHNQAPQVAPDEYHKRLVDFFDDHLGDIRTPQKPLAIPVSASVDSHIPLPSDVPNVESGVPSGRLTRA